MDRRFASAAHEALMIPNGYELPVECESKAVATHEFNSCTNRMVCACSSFKTPKSCHCSGKTIRNIREDTSNVLPINTQTMQIIMEEGELQALTNEGEITLAVQSNFMVEFDQYVVDLPCAITMEPMQGCYNCLKGAQIVSHCTTSLTSSVTIHCTDNAFTIDCDQSNKTTTSTLHMARAVVSQECHAKCAQKEVNVELRGILHYHPEYIPSFTFEEKTEEKNPAWHITAASMIIIISLEQDGAVGPSRLLSKF
ncbi:hypothetical protein ANCDUO_16545 [Ancylostoma duodenale]|uniref:Phlebovirus glycoprotein G2 C-terminal domain-containing protein n=1 Tax=Ancylostoma duodenale TaxID=51022 RepID=A0A0C2G352_9BILA|nr:hypothetical protein ANCDUO_16545 [Ancylostoma duodenale]